MNREERGPFLLLTFRWRWAGRHRTERGRGDDHAGQNRARSVSACRVGFEPGDEAAVNAVTDDMACSIASGPSMWQRPQ